MFSLTKEIIKDIVESDVKDIDYDAMHIASFMRSKNEFFVKFAEGIGNLAGDPSQVHIVKKAILTFGYNEKSDDNECIFYEKLLLEWKELRTPLRLIGTQTDEIVLLLEDLDRYVPIPRK